LICLQWYVFASTLRLSVYTLFGKNKIKSWQKFFCISKSSYFRTPMLISSAYLEVFKVFIIIVLLIDDRA